MTDIEGLDIKMDDQMIVIKCNDGNVSLSRRSCRLSSVLLAELSTNSDLEQLVYNKLETKYMKFVCQYLDYYKDKEDPLEIKKPLVSLEPKDIYNEWDLNFLDETMLEMDNFIQIINTASILGINTLEDLLCSRFAIMLKTKCLEELRIILNFPEPFTDITEEEENNFKNNNPEIFRLLQTKLEE